MKGQHSFLFFFNILSTTWDHPRMTWAKGQPCQVNNMKIQSYGQLLQVITTQEHGARDNLQNEHYKRTTEAQDSFAKWVSELVSWCFEPSQPLRSEHHESKARPKVQLSQVKNMERQHGTKDNSIKWPQSSKEQPSQENTIGQYGAMDNLVKWRTT